MLCILCIEKRSVQLQTVCRVTDCNVQQREFCSISDPHCSAQVNGKVVNKDMECCNLSVVDLDCQLVVALELVVGVKESSYVEGFWLEC